MSSNRVTGEPSVVAGDRRPIFVVGYQRSGTTLLQALLGAHPRIAAPPETYFIVRIANLADYYGDLGDDDNLRRALHDLIHPPLPLFEGCGFDEESLFERARATNRSYSALFDTMMRDFADRHGKERWSDKSPGQPARRVLDLFPDAQVLHIVRDPRDVIASSLDTPWTTLDASSIAQGWRSFTLDNIAVGRPAGEDRFLQVRYEDLTRDPEGMLRTVCAFLGEAFDPGMISDQARRRPTIASVAAPWQSRALGDIFAAPVGRWRERLGRIDAVRVAAILHREIRALGYEPATGNDVLAGRLLSVASIPRRLAGMRAQRRLPRESYDPAGRWRAVQDFMREQAARVGGTEPSGPR